jgi:hypothetical protein
MFAFLERDRPAAGRVLYPGALPPTLDTLEALGAPVTWTRKNPAPEHLWEIEAVHPKWGTVDLASHRKGDPLPDVIIDHTLALSDSEKSRARLGQATIEVRVRTRPRQLQASANYRADAIGADEDIPLHRSATLQNERGPVAGDRNIDDFAVEHQRVAANGLHQHAVQRLAQGDNYRPAELSIERPDQPAIGLAHLSFGRWDAFGSDGVGQPEIAERRHRVGRKRQREPQLARMSGLFVDLHLPAGPAKRQAGRQSTDSRTNDQCGARSRSSRPR